MTSSVTQQIGNTRITIHSKTPVLTMSREEQIAHFKRLQESGDESMRRIAGVLERFYAGGGDRNA